MKRDMDLARKILLAVEEFPENNWVPIEIDGADGDELSYHVKLLAQANLIEAQNCNPAALGPNTLDWKPIALTWDGHEFLELIRGNTQWDAAKSTLLSKVGSLPFDLLKEALSQLAKGQLAG